MKTRNKLCLVLAVIVLIAGITAGVYAGTEKDTVKYSGIFENPVADRIYIKLENTGFTIKKNESSNIYKLPFVLTVKKTQPDFYTVLNSVTFEGIDNAGTVFTALNSETEGKTTDSLILKDSEFSWDIEIASVLTETKTYEASVVFDFVSGVTKDTAVHKKISVPVKITVE